MHGDVLLLAIILSPCYPLTCPYDMPLVLLLLYLGIVYFELGGVCSKYIYILRTLILVVIIHQKGGIVRAFCPYIYFGDNATYLWD
jgi:hypothetical protein